MNIIKASASDFEIVKIITLKTIENIYPHYYPRGAVDFFINHHSDKNIENDIKNGNVYLCINNDKEPVGTVTITDNHINRLFVLLQHQGNGYGREIISFAEKRFFKATIQLFLTLRCLQRLYI